MHQNSISAGAPPQTPLGDLTSLPQTPSRMGRGFLPLPHPPKPTASRSQHLWRLELSPLLHTSTLTTALWKRTVLERVGAFTYLMSANCICILHCKLQCKYCNAISTQSALRRVRECTKIRVSRPQN